MVKYNNKSLGLGKDNFCERVSSKRLSSKRLKIQSRINTLKYHFLKSHKRYYKGISNENDIITMDSVEDIPKDDLYVFKIRNLNMGTSACNLLKWLLRSSDDQIPKNPYTNKAMPKNERKNCLEIAERFLEKNKKCLGVSHYFKNKELEQEIRDFKRIEYLRTNPEINIKLYLQEINSLMLEVKYLRGDVKRDSYYCYCCLQSYEQIADNNTPQDVINRIKNIGYTLESIYYKIDEIRTKIRENYFV